MLLMLELKLLLYIHINPEKVIANTTSNCQRTIHNANKRAIFTIEWMKINQRTNERTNWRVRQSKRERWTTERTEAWGELNSKWFEMSVPMVCCMRSACVCVCTDDCDEETKGKKQTDVHMNNYYQLADTQRISAQASFVRMTNVQVHVVRYDQKATVLITLMKNAMVCFHFALAQAIFPFFLVYTSESDSMMLDMPNIVPIFEWNFSYCHLTDCVNRFVHVLRTALSKWVGYSLSFLLNTLSIVRVKHLWCDMACYVHNIVALKISLDLHRFKMIDFISGHHKLNSTCKHIYLLTRHYLAAIYHFDYFDVKSFIHPINVRIDLKGITLSEHILFAEKWGIPHENGMWATK